ncbi:unnamed protein product [Moneuplotes crassus]|uniref:Uncharacterized protein n=1 Tax=Euplotes crassus TaxID=5936 RepID=A0AAD2D8M2_EUPCR|nr:unnamed protein product [Moneuplotes crassus]
MLQNLVSETHAELLRTNVHESNKEFDREFLLDDCDIPDEMDEDSPISAPLASRTENMSENILLRNKGHLKKADKLEFAARENFYTSVRIIPEMSLSHTKETQVKGRSQILSRPFKTPQKRTRVVRRNPNRAKSQIKWRKTRLSSTRKNIRGRKTPRAKRILYRKNKRTMSIDKRFTSTAFAPLYNSGHKTPPSRYIQHKVTGDFMCNPEVQKEPESDEFTSRGITMKDILPISN